MSLTQLKQKDIKTVRTNLLQVQSNKCAICDEEITEATGVSLDHQHKTLKETNGVDGAGLIRGVLCRACNVEEGKIWNSMSRYIQPKCVQDRITWLESLVEYYNTQNYTLIHPSEEPKEPLISKRQYNKLKKVYNKRAKFPEFPRSKKLTKKLELLYEEFNISPFI